MRNYLGRSAMFIAESLGRKEIEPVLREAGAKK